MVKNGVNGLIVKMKDGDDLADKIERLVVDKDLRSRMSAESRRLAEKMSWENVAKQYFQLYGEVLEKREIKK